MWHRRTTISLNKVKFAILVFSIGKNGQIVRKYYEFVKIFLKIF